MWQQWLNFIAGLWIAFSTYLGMTVESMQINVMVSGLVVAALGLWGALEHGRMSSEFRRHA